MGRGNFYSTREKTKTLFCQKNRRKRREWIWIFYRLVFSGIKGKMERLSTTTQESGFVSMHSQRSSSQSYTAASSLTSKGSVSYNSQSFSSKQQSFSQQKIAADTNGSIVTHRTTSSSMKSSSTNVTGTGDPGLLEKLVNVGVACSFFFLFFSFNRIIGLNLSHAGDCPWDHIS